MSAINAGDLVAVVTPCPYCGDSTGIGDMFVVASVCRAFGEATCCGVLDKNTVASSAADQVTGFGVIVTRLKRIDPSAKTNTVERKEEQPA